MRSHAAPGMRSRIGRVAAYAVLCPLLAVLLSGCLLISGATESADSTSDGGNVYVGFVSAEGSETRVVTTNFPEREIEITVLTRADRGQMRIDVLGDDGSSVIVVDTTAEEGGKSGTVRTNAQGEFRYRIQAAGAKSGTIQLLYRPTDG